MHKKTGQNPALYKCIIQAGYIAYSIEPSYLCGVCGNGVLVTIHDPIKKTGGIAHCVYPKLKLHQKPTNYHANIAVISLFKKLNQHKKLSNKIEAQLFGGGNLNNIKKDRAVELVGDIKNILNKYKVKIISEDIGGNMGRKVILNTHSGECIIHKTKKIRRTDWMPEFPRK